MRAARRRADPVGVILAGGEGTRIGGSKPTVRLRGKPLITYPLDALHAVLDEVAIIAKADTPLPSLPAATIWIEPSTTRHPLVGIVQALVLAAGRPVLVCAVDLPLITPMAIQRLVAADARGAPAVISSWQGELQPLLGRYEPKALELLPDTRKPSLEVPLKRAISELRPRLLEVEDPDELFNVNSPDDLLQAAAMLDRRRRLNRT